MQLIPLLLRILLSASVVLYGTGFVAAPVHAHGTDMHPAQQVTKQSQTKQAGQPAGHASDCHGADVDMPAPVDEPQATDCCQAATCSCHCSHHVQAVVVSATLLPPVVTAPASSVSPPGYMPPAAIGLNRPPIA